MQLIFKALAKGSIEFGAVELSKLSRTLIVIRNSLADNFGQILGRTLCERLFTLFECNNQLLPENCVGAMESDTNGQRKLKPSGRRLRPIPLDVCNELIVEKVGTKGKQLVCD